MWGDHGTRFGGIRQIKQGKLEERLPMNFVMFPTEFIKRRPHFGTALMANQDRLVTPSDYHATFEHILSLPYQEPFVPSMPYQMSILDEHPSKRLCADANVNPHHCTCYKRTNMAVNDTVVRLGTQAILDYLNNIVQEDDHAREVCRTLTLSKIADAELLEAKPDPLYQVQFYVAPGNSEFEGTFRYVGNKTIEVIPHYSRLTKYVGGSCGVKTHIMRVCYCKKKNKA